MENCNFPMFCPVCMYVCLWWERIEKPAKAYRKMKCDYWNCSQLHCTHMERHHICLHPQSAAQWFQSLTFGHSLDWPHKSVERAKGSLWRTNLYFTPGDLTFVLGPCWSCFKLQVISPWCYLRPVLLASFSLCSKDGCSRAPTILQAG